MLVIFLLAATIVGSAVITWRQVRSLRRHFSGVRIESFRIADYLQANVLDLNATLLAVLGILKSANVPKSLEIQIACESLFNDGVGIAVFVVLHEVAVRGDQPSLSHISAIFLQEAVGGAVIGLSLGWVAYRLLKSVDHYQVEVLLTLALVTGGYALAGALHTSGPIASFVPEC